jgi:hypothetical protein
MVKIQRKNHIKVGQFLKQKNVHFHEFTSPEEIMNNKLITQYFEYQSP